MKKRGGRRGKREGEKERKRKGGRKGKRERRETWHEKVCVPTSRFFHTRKLPLLKKSSRRVFVFYYCG